MDNRQPEIIRPTAWSLLLLLLAVMTPGAFAIDLLGTAGDDLLEPDRAFAINSMVVDEDTVSVSWTIADGYYLYRDRVKFSSATDGITLGTPDMPPGKIKDDEFFGKIAIFRNTVTATIPVTRSANAPDSFELKAVSQGCADIGVCYPPHTQVASLTLPAMEPGGMSTAQAATAPTTTASHQRPARTGWQ